MIGFETIVFLLILGFASLIITLLLYFTGKGTDIKKENEEWKFEVKVFNSQLKLIPFLYLIIVLIMFLIGIFSDFLINSIFGLIISLIPFIAYLIFDYKKDEPERK